MCRSHHFFLSLQASLLWCCCIIIIAEQAVPPSSSLEKDLDNPPETSRCYWTVTPKTKQKKTKKPKTLFYLDRGLLSSFVVQCLHWKDREECITAAEVQLAALITQVSYRYRHFSSDLSLMLLQPDVCRSSTKRGWYSSSHGQRKARAPAETGY